MRCVACETPPSLVVLDPAHLDVSDDGGRHAAADGDAIQLADGDVHDAADSLDLGGDGGALDAVFGRDVNIEYAG